MSTLHPEHESPFTSLEQARHAAHLGMWLFLTSEVLLFGALFGLYFGYRAAHPDAFQRATAENDVVIGTANTLILISSSLAAAWSVHSLRQARRRAAFTSLLLTVALGLAFLVLKALEYREHFAQGIYPGSAYAYAGLPSDGARLFFMLYYLMTGLHALHVIGGLTALAIVAILVRRGRYGPANDTAPELTVLYWHLVDCIWIFLWPLLYLVR
jgi:cytochrome c oxidase subunit 3